MPTADADIRKCPLCLQTSMRKHCSSPTCKWEACLNDKCKATLDEGKRIGFVKDPLERRDPKDRRYMLWLRLAYNKVRGWHARDDH